MSKSVGEIHEPTAQEGVPGPQEIGYQLQRILASPVFHGSKRCQQFLEYVCLKSLAGELGTLKERSIAVEVFGRPPDIDLGEDTIVRVGAREVRKRLAQYYVTPEGAAARVRIHLPSGSYAPDFRYMSTAPDTAPTPARRTAFERPHGRKLAALGAIAAVAVLAVLAILRLTTPTPNAQAFQRFWEPVLRSREPLLVAMAHPIVYHPSSHALQLSEQNQLPQEMPLQRPLQVAPKDLNGSDIVPVQNQYVGVGDMIAANEISSMLSRKSHGARVRLASTIDFADLRNTPVLLIGSITNRWTMEMQQSWRFRFAWTAETRAMIVDTQAKGGHEWSVPPKDDGSAPEDYILVSRIHSTATGGLLIVAAGLKQFGTEAAGRLLADPVQLGAILRSLSPGWEPKSLQLVLHARVIRNNPALPDVVSSCVW